MLSGGMFQAGRNTNQTVTQMNRGMNSVAQSAKMASVNGTRSIATLERYLKMLERKRSISLDTSQFNRQIHRVQEEIARMKNSALDGGSKGGMLGSFVAGNLISGGVQQGLSYAKGFIEDSLSSAMDYQKNVKSFEVLTGNAQKGQQLAADLRNLKQTTIMGASVYKNAQTMMGFGIGGDEVVKDLRQIGDIAMGDVDRMQSLTLAFSQTRASGRLMGQDLLQYINAGFNPLSVMSERWKDFGFKQQKSVGQLKQMMEKGAISSGMVAKAFELATSQGGRFYKMMDSIGETSAGQLMKLKGNWAAFQIDMGNALMPLANNFMQAANDVLHFFNISKTVPETLMDERLEINTLVSSISQLNQGNQIRGNMIDTLVSKYPDLFGNISREKITNNELLGVLNNVNNAYEKRIQLAQFNYRIQGMKDETAQLQSLIIKAREQAGVYKTGVSGIFTNNKYLGPIDRLHAENLGLKWEGGFNSAQGYMNFAKAAEKLYNDKLGSLSTEMVRKDINSTIFSANDLLKDAKKQKDLWGNNAGQKAAELRKELGLYGAARNSGGGGWSQAVLNFNLSNIKKLIGTGATTGGGSGIQGMVTGNGTGADGLSAGGITHNGPKQINVYFQKEMFGSLSINTTNVKEGVGEIEKLIEEGIYRVLYSLESEQ